MTTNNFDVAGKKIWVAGHNGMVGKAVVRRLVSEPCTIITAERNQVDLKRQACVEKWMAENKPDAVIIAAAKVGGIHANSTYPADFLYDNLMIECNIVEASRQVGVSKLVMLGSTCIYPRMSPQPIPENAILTGPLEATNEWYAIAKIAGIKLCQSYRRQYGCDFISAMPTNLYGKGDNFHAENSHVVPAMMRRIHLARIEHHPEVAIWGTGTPKREFLHVDDCADAIVYLLKNYSALEHVNVGTGEDVSISLLAETIKKVVGYQGRFVYDTTKPDGTPRKLSDVSMINSLGWKHRISLEQGLASTYEWFKQEEKKGALRL